MTEELQTEKNYCRILHKRSGSSYTYEVKQYVDGIEAKNIEDARKICHTILQRMITQEES